jgi:hypothetical protein
MPAKTKPLGKQEETKKEEAELERPEAARTRKPENLFSKEQLIHSERFRDRRDLLEALLLSGGQYTIRQAEQMMEDYRKGKVK